MSEYNVFSVAVDVETGQDLNVDPAKLNDWPLGYKEAVKLKKVLKNLPNCRLYHERIKTEEKQPNYSPRFDLNEKMKLVTVMTIMDFIDEFFEGNIAQAADVCFGKSRQQISKWCTLGALVNPANCRIYPPASEQRK